MSLFKNFLLGSIFFASTYTSFAQESSLRGTVYSENGATVSSAHIYLSDNQWAVSDDSGAFEIKSLVQGEYKIKVSSIGYRQKIVPFVITSNAITTLEIVLKEKIYKDVPVVVTASRTRKELEDVSVPITVIEKDEISQSGSLRLSDILDEQVGLNIVSDHGTGIQVQGFDPDYTLILVDNQPVIGRTAGTLDLTRLAVGGIKQIEMVKGPSSALWGSDALAGVINIITEKGSKPFSWDVTGRMGSNTSYDASSNMTFKKNNFNGRFFTNLNSSAGYDLNESSIAPTVPKYQNQTLSGGLNYRFNSILTLGVSTRYYSEDQQFHDEILDQNTFKKVNGTQNQEDYSIAPEAKITLGDRQLFEASAFLSRFNSESSLIYNETGEAYSSDYFDQTLNKFELKSTTFWSNEHTSVVGIGLNREDLTAEIYADVPYFESYFAFGQHEWLLTQKLSLTTGFRFDAHSEYASQFSPKFSGLYKPNDFIHFRASLGSGFKAPEFRQLFLNFTNPIVGYSVYGSSTVLAGIETLQENGQIQELYYDPSDVIDIKAEHSFAYNFGVDIFPAKEVQIRTNLFRNNVQDLIETQRIALKTTGQSVFSYFNLNKIYTQGAEIELRYKPELIQGLRISLGYQYLDAQREITKTFDDVVDGEVVSVSKKDYLPLFNRSTHSGNVKLFYLLDRIGVESSLRFQFRGKYWFADSNNNQTVDINEYALRTTTLKGFAKKTIINASLAKSFYNRFRLQVGVNNLFNYQNEVFLPSNPGLTFYTQLNIKIH